MQKLSFKTFLEEVREGKSTDSARTEMVINVLSNRIWYLNFKKNLYR